MEEGTALDQWKRSVELVAVSDLESPRAPDIGWPTHRRMIEARDPALATLIDELGIVSIAARDAARLTAAGITTYTVGYDRRSDGWHVARTGAAAISRTGEVNEVASAVLAARGARDVESDDGATGVLDAIVRVLSDGVLDEHRVVVAAMLPTIGAPLEALDAVPSLVARAAHVPASGANDALVDEVRRVLAEMSERIDTTRPIVTTLPRGAYALLGLFSAAAAALLAMRAPIVASLAVLVTLCFFFLATRRPAT